MKLTINTNFPQVQRALDNLREEVAAKAAARAVNATIAQAKTEMSRQIRQEYVVDARFVRERLRIKRATFFKGVLAIEAVLSADEKPRSANLIRFVARRTKAGVSVKIKRAGARKVVRGAFIGNKGRTVFRRITDKRLPIKAISTVDVAQMFNAKRINARVVTSIRENFARLFESEARFFVAKFNRG